MLFPDCLLSQQPNPKCSLVNINQGVFQVYKKGAHAVDLKTGDVVQITNVNIASDNIKVAMVNKNILGCERQKNYEDLATNDWEKVDERFLKDVNLRPEEAYILYAIIDSLQIKTDINKSSSLVLGEFFDIGLQFFRIRNNKVEDTLFVPDIVMLSRHKSYTQRGQNAPNENNDDDIDELEFCIRQEKYDRNMIYYDVWIVPKAKGQIKMYIKAFPEIIDFLRQKNVRNEFRSTDISRKYITVHELYNISPRAEEDPNINLFKIYSWLLKCDISMLKLYSGLSLVNISLLNTIRMHAKKKWKKY